MKENNTQSWRQLPIFKKALAILELVEYITDSSSIDKSNAGTTYEVGMIEYHI